MAKKVSIDNFAKELTNIVENYQKDTTDEIKEAVNVISKQCKDNIRNGAPHKDSDYKKSWSIRRKNGMYDFTATVYARSPHYRLTHLLEKGHVKKNPYTGKVLGRVQAFPHIAPAEHVAQLGMIAKVKRIYGK